ncbi:uncharacterized protein SETTUDRAFT_36324 [Exserohilum turcica Et28A]|uniref:Uncharacterized protein n=1 Tax=Exserohilum turcicum (strain 28A) TaxID=671987 RepID=R0J229_EXST2|nr:uncharacterized protein SETTUDRAFT_36324 [Exserohilum turcica Et28A]EOA90821.1 hypothetical protein SETTUDRAFT_36324 [Exserohilum turcica Et28A]
MGSQETIPDDTLYPKYQSSLLFRDNIDYPASGLAELAQASKQSNDKKSEEQPGECTSHETKKGVCYTNAGYKPEESGTEIAGLFDELKDVDKQMRHLQDKKEILVSCLQEAFKRTTQNTLHISGKLVRWADSTGTSSLNDDTCRPRKKARRSS